MSVRRRNEGFTLIELLIVVAIIGVIASVAAPGLLRARMAGNEASAIASLRAVNAAQSIFAASCGNGYYAPSLEALGTPPDGGDGFIGTDLNTDPSVKSAYTITLTGGAAATGAPASCNGVAAGGLVTTYFVGGEPQPGGGVRNFGTNQGGTIYFISGTPVPATQRGAPSGAEPIQ